jgi:hypothetical protein
MRQCAVTVRVLSECYTSYICVGVCEFCWSAVYASMWWVPQEYSIFSDVVSSVRVLRVLRCKFHWRVMIYVGVRKLGSGLLASYTLRANSTKVLHFCPIIFLCYYYWKPKFWLLFVSLLTTLFGCDIWSARLKLHQMYTSMYGRPAGW